MSINVPTPIVNKAPRNSSIELFRILATFLVLIVHLNGWLIGGMPEKFSMDGGCAFRISQMIIEALSAVCVNCFIIISGYFGMKLSSKSLWKIFSTLLCIYLPCWIVTAIIQHSTSIEDALNGVLVFSREGYFVQCYLMVLFLSPIYNAFIEKYGKSATPYIFVFWGIEIWFEQIRGNISLGFNHGYSVIHFSLLYLLSRLLALHKDKILRIISFKKSICIYFCCAIIVCVLYITGWKNTWDYSNPIIVAESFFLFLPFLHFNYYNKYVNWIASSTFAVYVLHTCKPMNPVLRDLDRYICTNYSFYVWILFMLVAAVLTFFICIVYDKLRLLITRKVDQKIESKILDMHII